MSVQTTSTKPSASARRLGHVAPQPVAAAPADRPRRPVGVGAHSCTSAVRSLRIRMITSGISSGSADITAATPSRGCARSKA